MLIRSDAVFPTALFRAGVCVVLLDFNVYVYLLEAMYMRLSLEAVRRLRVVDSACIKCCCVCLLFGMVRCWCVVIVLPDSFSLLCTVQELGLTSCRVLWFVKLGCFGVGTVSVWWSCPAGVLMVVLWCQWMLRWCCYGANTKSYVFWNNLQTCNSYISSFRMQFPISEVLN